MPTDEIPAAEADPHLQAHDRRKRQKRKPASGLRQCRHCGTEFDAGGRRGGVSYCSTAHRKAAWRTKGAGYARTYRRRKRAKRFVYAPAARSAVSVDIAALWGKLDALDALDARAAGDSLAGGRVEALAIEAMVGPLRRMSADAMDVWIRSQEVLLNLGGPATVVGELVERGLNVLAYQASQWNDRAFVRVVAPLANALREAGDEQSAQWALVLIEDGLRLLSERPRGDRDALLEEHHLHHLTNQILAVDLNAPLDPRACAARARLQKLSEQLQDPAAAFATYRQNAAAAIRMGQRSEARESTLAAAAIASRLKMPAFTQLAWLRPQIDLTYGPSGRADPDDPLVREYLRLAAHTRSTYHFRVLGRWHLRVDAPSDGVIVPVFRYESGEPYAATD